MRHKTGLALKTRSRCLRSGPAASSFLAPGACVGADTRPPLLTLIRLYLNTSKDQLTPFSLRLEAGLCG